MRKRRATRKGAASNLGYTSSNPSIAADLSFSQVCFLAARPLFCFQLISALFCIHEGRRRGGSGGTREGNPNEGYKPLSTPGSQSLCLSPTRSLFCLSTSVLLAVRRNHHLETPPSILYLELYSLHRSDRLPLANFTERSQRTAQFREVCHGQKFHLGVKLLPESASCFGISLL